MQYTLIPFFLVSCLSFAAVEAGTPKPIEINPTSKVALLDGRCGNDEWDVATNIALPAQVSVQLMYDKDFFYLCAKGKAEDYTVLDLYIEHAETGHLHHFHLSAQMGERTYTEKGWGKSATWDLKDYAGFWVPFFGLEDPDNNKGPKFASGTHRQMQIARKKFSGDVWNMMIGVSAVEHNGEWPQLNYPEKAVDSDKSTWARFSFSKLK